MILPAFACKKPFCYPTDFRNIFSKPGKYGIPDAMPPESGGGAIPCERKIAIASFFSQTMALTSAAKRE